MSNGSFSSEKDKPSHYQPLTQASNEPVVVNDRYELLELTGQGAMSRIYRSLDRVLDRIVAVKLLREEYGSDEGFVARFFREARAVAKLSSPNIVDIYDYGQYNNTYFIVMPFIEGTNLKELIRHERILPVEDAVSIAAQVLVGLAAAHSQAIIHRDVKPQNILIRSSDGAALLVDFGVAYARDGVSITTGGMAIGTAYYMAPEQASAGLVGPFTDLYAVGVVLFEMLAGRLPFLAANQMQIMLQHVNDRPPTLRSIGVPVSPELDHVVQKALMKDPARRFQTALEMREALLNIPLTGLTEAYDESEAGVIPLNRPVSKAGQRAYEAATAVQGTPLRWPARRPGLIIFWLVGLLGLVGLGLVGLLAISNTPDPTPMSLVALPVVPTSSELNAADPLATAIILPATVAGSSRVSVQATAALPTVTFAPTIQPTTALPTQVPATPTLAPPPTATAVPPTATAVPPTPTRVIPTATAPPPTINPANSGLNANSFSPYSLSGAYKRDDGTLYGRPEVALYGAGSGYEQGTVNFKLESLPPAKVFLVLTGLDDERRENCNLKVTLNGTVIYNGPSGFPDVPTSDNGEGGPDRYWGQFEIGVPVNLFMAGTNSLVLSNTTPWTGQLGIPYILINQLKFSPGQ
jgi:serine/threonine-protein kinase